MAESILRKYVKQTLSLLPYPIAKAIYYPWAQPKVFHAEVLDDIYIDLEVPTKNKVWVTRLSQKKGHEIGICLWLKEHLRNDDIFFDVGSCFGFFPAFINQIHPSVRIAAFEPCWPALVHLRNNQKRIGSKWIIKGSFVGQTSSANTIALDSFSSAHAMTPTIVKIDVDGPECDVLAGARQLIQNRETEFLIEVHPRAMPSFGGSVEKILGFFNDDFTLKILPQIRYDCTEWSDNLDLLQQDDNPYIYAAPKERSRL